MTTIKIENLEIFANHGVLKEENVLGQKFVLSIVMDMHTSPDDDINNTINYADVCAFAEKFLQGRTYNLIETAASELAKRIMVNFPKATRAWVEIKKPWAPIHMNVEYVSAAAEAKWHCAYLSAGSNMGDRRRRLKDAEKMIGEDKYCRIRRASDIIETKPVGDVEQNDFLNSCFEVHTLYEPFEFLEFLHGVENAGERTHEVHWGPRTIDLDIILYDDIVLTTPELTIPHKEMKNRYFVLKPLSEIVPDKRHPVSGETVRELLGKVSEG